MSTGMSPELTPHPGEDETASGKNEQNFILSGQWLPKRLCWPSVYRDRYALTYSLYKEQMHTSLDSQWQPQGPRSQLIRWNPQAEKVDESGYLSLSNSCWYDFKHISYTVLKVSHKAQVIVGPVSGQSYLLYHQTHPGKYMVTACYGIVKGIHSFVSLRFLQHEYLTAMLSEQFVLQTVSGN